MYKKQFLTLTLTLMLLVVTLIQNSYSELGLTLTVTTDKQTYNVGEIVQITGNLTLNGSPVENGLISLEIDDRTGTSLIYRTLDTGTLQADQWKIEILNAYMGDSEGNPLSSIHVGQKCYVWVWYQNNWDEPIYTVLTFTIYDSEDVPLSTAILAILSVAPGGPYFVYNTWTVPDEAALGMGKIYASAFLDITKNSGTPHCPEKSSNFTITSSSLAFSGTATQFQTQEGTFYTSLRLSKTNSLLGSHIIYTASLYEGQLALDTATFGVTLIGDINGDKKVNILDAIKLSAAFGSQEGDSNWNPKADLNDDKKVNILDAIILSVNFGNKAS